jgi:hypothetical protein
MRSVIYAVTYIECHIEALNAECRYAQCHYVKCHCAEFLGSFKSSFKRIEVLLKLRLILFLLKYY